MSEKRILLVEDEILIRMIMVETLTDAGYAVLEAADSIEARDRIEGPDGFDLLLTDIQMPGGADGMELARLARQLHPDIPVVYVTGRPDVIDRARTLDARAALLEKPYSPRDVIEVIGQLLDDTEPQGG